ncbi:hypothetical protein [Brucella intermedia]|uniref:hypothetical protein n=1 Tax=Brucella intermedia TaxID=94625 RepID=UPI00235FE124|nr:hypothetical protein [Brucella intermedia]
MYTPRSISDWLALVEHHERVALAMVNDKLAAGQAAFHAGLAVECALKAYIWHVERFNQWPDKGSRPDLYHHNLRKLKGIAGVTIKATDNNAPSWHVMLSWDRNQGYDPQPMPRKVAKSYIEASFGDEGVVTWIRAQLTNAY